MKKILYIGILAFFFIFGISYTSFAAQPPELTDEQKAIREVANAYYNKCDKVQYSTPRKSFREQSPEDATFQNTIYKTCSAFTFSVYWNAFGIAIPASTQSITSYAKQYYDAGNTNNNDVIEYYQKVKNGKNFQYFDNKENLRDIDLSNDAGQKAYANYLLTKLQVGDILCWSSDSSGHALLVYEILYDSTGKPINALIRDCNSGDSSKDIVTTKVQQGFLYSYIQYQRSDDLNSIYYEGSISERYLFGTYGKSDKSSLITLLTSESRKYFSIIRPLIKDGNEYKYYTLSNGMRNQLKKLNMPDSSKQRIQYNGIYIEKTVSAWDNSTVALGETLEYTIRITNKSNTISQKTYESFDVIEKIPDEVTIVNLGGGTYDENTKTIKWTKNNLGLNNTYEIKYNVQVKADASLIGKTITSNEGTVAGIPSGTVKNYISSNLDTSAKLKIKNETKQAIPTKFSIQEAIENQNTDTTSNSINELLEEDHDSNIDDTSNYTVANATDTYGYNFVSDIYKNAFNINLNLQNLKLNELLSRTENAISWMPTTSSKPNVYVNEEHKFSDMVLKNYYGSLGFANGRMQQKRWSNTIGSRSERTDNIYSGNLQTGDILVYQNNQDPSLNPEKQPRYKKEDGTYFLIYISKADAIQINGTNIYGFIGLNKKDNQIIPPETTEIINIYRDESDYDKSNPDKYVEKVKANGTYHRALTDYSINDLRTLLGKDYYVVLRPSTSLDILPMDLQVTYSATAITNKNVTVTITSTNEEMLPITGWTLSDDKKVLTKIYTKNTNEQLQIYDYAGNQKTVDIIIQNIDKQKPTLDITYNVTTLTNQNVTAYIRANEKIKKADGWTLSEDQKTLTKTYSSNQTETVSITDLAGNTSTATINIVNIDKQNPIVEITYSTTSPTFNDVIVTIASNEELRGLEGWQLSSNKKSLSKTYTNNNEETIIVYDLAGNSATANIKIENIDKEKPQYEITYSTTLATNKDVTVTITANKEIQEIDGWTLSQDKKVLTKTYTENTEEEITIQDLVGNKSSKTTITINNIDRDAPIINVSYGKVSPTTKDVLVTLTSNEVIRNVADWTLSANSMQLSKIYRANTTEQITITDEAGNSITLSIEVSNIPEVPPEDDGNSEDTPTPGGEVNPSQEDTTDPATSNQTVSTQGGKTSSSQTDTSNSTEPKVDVRVIKSTDTTTSNKILPQTGEKSILIFIAVLAIISTVAYLKFRKYRL